MKKMDKVYILFHFKSDGEREYAKPVAAFECVDEIKLEVEERNLLTNDDEWFGGREIPFLPKDLPYQEYDRRLEQAARPTAGRMNGEQ
jgi:hypothetical protein